MLFVKASAIVVLILSSFREASARRQRQDIPDNQKSLDKNDPAVGHGHIYKKLIASLQDRSGSDWRDLLTDDIYRSLVNKPRGHNHLFESDIKKDDFRKPSAGGSGPFRNAVSDRSLRWEGGIVPYEISEAFAESERSLILEAMRDMMAKTCIRFTPRSGQSDYIKFVRRNMGCSSYVGRIGGEQLIDLMVGCMYQIGEPQHEIMHALGFYHEQSRSDRDNYVNIIWSNILDGAEDQFTKYRTDNLNMPYDYDSIMHYGWNYFAKDSSLPTILPRDTGTKRDLGNRKLMTDLDVEKINRLYECSRPEHTTPRATPATTRYQPRQTPPSWNRQTPRTTTTTTTRRRRRPHRPPSHNPHPENTSLWQQFKDNVREWLMEHAHA